MRSRAAFLTLNRIASGHPETRMPEAKTTLLGTVKVKFSGAEVGEVSSSQELAGMVAAKLGGSSGVPGGSLLAKMIVLSVYERLKEEDRKSGGRGAVLSFRVGSAAAVSFAMLPLAIVGAPFAAAAAFPTVSGPDDW